MEGFLFKEKDHYSPSQDHLVVVISDTDLFNAMLPLL